MMVTACRLLETVWAPAAGRKQMLGLPFPLLRQIDSLLQGSHLVTVCRALRDELLAEATAYSIVIADEPKHALALLDRTLRKRANRLRLSISLGHASDQTSERLEAEALVRSAAGAAAAGAPWAAVWRFKLSQVSKSS
jgi:hypothetical protein